MAKDKKTNNAAVKKVTHPAVVVQDMTLVSPDRNTADIGKLKAAIQRAESITLPKRVQLYDIYNHITTIDGHLSGIIEKRVAAVQNKSLYYKDKKGRRVDAFETLISSQKFNDLVRIIIESRLWGISGVEFMVGSRFDFEEVPRKHIIPERNIIVQSQYANEGTDIDDLPFVWTVGKKRDLGKLLTCAMYSLYKINGFGDFAQFVEIFGQPVRIIYYDAYDTKTKEQLSTLLKTSGSSLAMMIPKQAQFQMLDGKTANSNGDLQLNFIRACNDEMSIAVLGNTETTAASRSSGYAQAKVQSEQQFEITKSDLAFVQNTLNDAKFLRILQSYGYPVTEGGGFEFEQEVDIEKLKARLDIDREVSLKVPLSDDYWYDTYGLPKPDNYDELIAKREEERRAMLALAKKAEESKDGNDNGDNKKDKGKNLFANLYDFFVKAPPTASGANPDTDF